MIRKGSTECAGKNSRAHSDFDLMRPRHDFEHNFVPQIRRSQRKSPANREPAMRRKFQPASIRRNFEIDLTLPSVAVSVAAIV